MEEGEIRGRQRRAGVRSPPSSLSRLAAADEGVAAAAVDVGPARAFVRVLPRVLPRVARGVDRPGRVVDASAEPPQAAEPDARNLALRGDAPLSVEAPLLRSDRVGSADGAHLFPVCLGDALGALADELVHRRRSFAEVAQDEADRHAGQLQEALHEAVLVARDVAAAERLHLADVLDVHLSRALVDRPDDVTQPRLAVVRLAEAHGLDVGQAPDAAVLEQDVRDAAVPAPRVRVAPPKVGALRRRHEVCKQIQDLAPHEDPRLAQRVVEVALHGVVEHRARRVAVQKLRVVEEDDAKSVDHSLRARDGLADVRDQGRAWHAQERRDDLRPLGVRNLQQLRRPDEEESSRKPVAALKSRGRHRAGAPRGERSPHRLHARLLALQGDLPLDLVDWHAVDRPGASRLDAERSGVRSGAKRRRDLGPQRPPRRAKRDAEPAPRPAERVEARHDSPVHRSRPEPRRELRHESPHDAAAREPVDHRRDHRAHSACERR
mmetsp:Transcript_27368/g.97760  ORF Transcript_27368/g.97760 Transcript_27368/m.97760 type:complete len:493 (-) Transcript_27368:91-1569(-)